MKFIEMTYDINNDKTITKTTDVVDIENDQIDRMRLLAVQNPGKIIMGLSTTGTTQIYHEQVLDR